MREMYVTLIRQILINIPYNSVLFLLMERAINVKTNLYIGSGNGEAQTITRLPREVDLYPTQIFPHGSVIGVLF